MRMFMKGGITPVTTNPGEALPRGPLLTLAEGCWDYDPDQRPTAAEALQTLSDLNTEDDRPSMASELAMFSFAKEGRSYVKVDYDTGVSILEQVSSLLRPF
jgi:hypothetical protein